MNKIRLLSVFSLIAGTISAQHTIDLSKVSLPSVKYLTLGNPGPAGKEIRINNLYMDEGGIPKLPVMGEFHYSRMQPDYWRDALLKMKASGINIVATYCLWSLHEETEGELSWEGHLNLRRFVELCKELGLKVHLSVGPYCNAEIKNTSKFARMTLYTLNIRVDGIKVYMNRSMACYGKMAVRSWLFNWKMNM